MSFSHIKLANQLVMCVCLGKLLYTPREEGVRIYGTLGVPNNFLFG